MVVTSLEYIAVAAIGVTGSAATLFGSYIGLRNYEKLPGKLFTKYNSIVYCVFGGALALILQLAFPESFAPLYSLAVGAGWPALVIGFSTSINAQQLVDAELKKWEDLQKKIEGGQ